MTDTRVHIDHRPRFRVIAGGLADPAPTRADPEVVEVVVASRAGAKLRVLAKAVQLRAKGKLTDTAITVLSYLVQAVDETLRCTRYVHTIAQGTGLGNRTVKRALKMLDDAHLISRRSRYTESGRCKLAKLATEFTLRPPLQAEGHLHHGAARDPTPRAARGPEDLSQGYRKEFLTARRRRRAPAPQSSVHTGNGSDGPGKRQRAATDPATAHPARSPNLSRELFGPDVLRWLMSTGIAERRARAIIGKWRKQYKDKAVAEAICAAWEKQVTEPISWVSAALRSRGGGGRRNDTMERVSAAAEKMAAWMNAHPIGSNKR